MCASIHRIGIRKNYVKLTITVRFRKLLTKGFRDSFEIPEVLRELGDIELWNNPKVVNLTSNFAGKLRCIQLVLHFLINESIHSARKNNSKFCQRGNNWELIKRERTNKNRISQATTIEINHYQHRRQTSFVEGIQKLKREGIELALRVLVKWLSL